MSIRPVAQLVSVVSLVLLIAAAAAGCRGNTPEPSSELNSSIGTIQAGGHPFAFDYQTVTDLLIVKSDPVTGDRWTARVARPDAQTIQWEIKSDEGAHSLLDRKADGYFILHLLDTLRSLQVSEVNVSGSLESIGLSPPRYALQWQSGGQHFEIRLGSPIPKTGKAYACLPGQPPFTAEGATFQMLDYINDFASLRLKTWVGLTSDEVDEIELKRPGKPVFYAQRDGANWTSRAHRPVHGDVSAWLDALTHSRVLQFIDDATPAAALRSQTRKRPFREIALTDRHGNVVLLQIARIGKQLIGLSSARPQGVFELYPQILRSFEPPRK